ncbi:putative TonB-dependent receptor precursor, partial [Haemophilus influenzae]
MDNRN